MPTPMQKMQALLAKIPRGKVTTYKEMARAMGTKGYRYVGQLLNKNPKPEKFPCYKVVKSDGTLGGFAMGCAQKIKRLKLDGIEVHGDKLADFKKVFFRFR